MKNQEIYNPHCEQTASRQNNIGVLDNIRPAIRLLVLVSVISACGPAGIRKDIEDIPFKADPNILIPTAESITHVAIELEKILPPDELDAFKHYTYTVHMERKIDLGLYFLSNYPDSLVASRVKLELEEKEAVLFAAIMSLLDSAKANPDDFLSKHVVDKKQDEFLHLVSLFTTRFPANSNRDIVVQAMQDYITAVGYNYIQIDQSDDYLIHQDEIKPGEFAFVKLYEESEDSRTFRGISGFEYEKFNVRKWAVVSVDGEKVGISQDVTITQSGNFWQDNLWKPLGKMITPLVEASVIIREQNERATKQGYATDVVLDLFIDEGLARLPARDIEVTITQVGGAYFSKTLKTTKKNLLDTGGEVRFSMVPAGTYKVSSPLFEGASTFEIKPSTQRQIIEITVY